MSLQNRLEQSTKESNRAEIKLANLKTTQDDQSAVQTEKKRKEK